MTGKILGGENIEPGSKKYMASIRHNEVHFCTGFLVTNGHVLTRAHCLKDFLVKRQIPDFRNYSILTGDLNEENKTRHEISQLEIPKSMDFNKTKSSYDFGLITVDQIQI